MSSRPAGCERPRSDRRRRLPRAARRTWPCDTGARAPSTRTRRPATADSLPAVRDRPAHSGPGESPLTRSHDRVRSGVGAVTRAAHTGSSAHSVSSTAVSPVERLDGRWVNGQSRGVPPRRRMTRRTVCRGFHGVRVTCVTMRVRCGRESGQSHRCVRRFGAATPGEPRSSRTCHGLCVDAARVRLAVRFAVRTVPC